MWIIQETNTLELWNKLHFEEKKKRRVYTHKVKWSRYRPGVAQRVCRGIALLFMTAALEGGWVVSITPRPHFTPVKDPVPIVQEAGWATGPVWTGGKIIPTEIRSRTVQPKVQLLNRLSYRAHMYICVYIYIYIYIFTVAQQPPSGTRFPRYRGFTIKPRHTTVGRTPLGKWSARCRDLYVTTHNIQTSKRQRRNSNPQPQQVSGRRLTP